MTQLEEITRICKNVPLHFDLSYGHICDFLLEIYKRMDSKNEIIYSGQDNDLPLLLSRGEIALKEWCMENNGGY